MLVTYDHNVKFRKNCERLELIESQIKKSITDLYQKHCEIDYKRNENYKIEEHFDKLEDENLNLKHEITVLRDKLRILSSKRIVNFEGDRDDDIK